MAGLMRARTILAALLLAVGLVAVPTSAQAVNDNLYSFRSCAEYGRLGTGPSKYVCLKVYARRQSDGLGWVLNSVHIYAWTEGQGLGHCGSGFNNPAVADPSRATTYGSDDGANWSREANLTDGNGCDVLWGSNPGAFITFGGDHFTVNYFEQAHLSFQQDPGMGKLHQRFEPDGNGGVRWLCTANICNWEGPF